MSTICATCCSRNRKLSTISPDYENVLHKILSSCESFKDYIWNESLQICHECNKMIQNIISFRNKVLKSIKIFEEICNKRKHSGWKTEVDQATVCDTEIPRIIAIENVFIGEDIKMEGNNANDKNKLDSTMIETAGEEHSFVQVNLIKSEFEGRDRREDQFKPHTELAHTIGIKSEDESTDTCDEEEIDEEKEDNMVTEENAENDELESVTKDNPGPSQADPSSPKERPKGRHLSSIEKKIAVNLYNRLLSDAPSYPYKDEAKKKAAEIMGISRTTMYRALKENAKAAQSTKEPTWFIRILSDEQVLQEMDDYRSKDEFQNAPHKCESCVMVFNDSFRRMEHANLFHDKTGQFPCRFCSRNLVTDTELEEHLSQHYKRYTCTLCLFEADNIDGVRDHECSYDETTFKQSIITKKFLNESKQYKCDICNKDFHHKSIRDRHMDVIHGDNQQTVQCKICNVTLKNEYSLPGHMHWHRNQTKKANKVESELGELYYCKTCDAQFDKKHLYKQHLKTSLKHINQDEMKYPCNYCDRKFLSPCHVRIHMNGVHFKQNGYKCTQCDKSYGTKSNLRVHIEQKHENKQKEKKYICEVCASAFSSNNILKAHMRRHTGERPFKCKLCAATFSYSGALYTHNKLVHENVKKTWKKNKKKQKIE